MCLFELGAGVGGEKMKATVCNLDVMGTRAGRNLEATIKANSWNATAGAGRPPKSPMAQATVMGCLIQAEQRAWEFWTKGKTLS